MLKWTASAQKLMQESAAMASMTTTMCSPYQSTGRRERRHRRATIAATVSANKENIPMNYVTSTPMVAAHIHTRTRTRNSPLVLAPLTDILNVTPETTPSRGESQQQQQQQQQHQQQQQRRVAVAVENVYATTLPRFVEEEYSPSSAGHMLPCGQHLALRGLLPLPLDPFVGNPRYFATPEMASATVLAQKYATLPKKRKLAQEFAEIADEEQLKHKAPTIPTPPPARVARVASTSTHTTTNAAPHFTSAKMGDQTLDKLIDAILDSACKEEKKQKKSRKSFNLRRRTLLKNQVDNMHEQQMLSPSYAPGDDPASDLSFLLCDPSAKMLTPSPPTPTPMPGTPLPFALLTRVPTACQVATLHATNGNNNNNNNSSNNNINNTSDEGKSNTFMLETPIRPIAQKRRHSQLQLQQDNQTNRRLRVRQQQHQHQQQEQQKEHQKEDEHRRDEGAIGVGVGVASPLKKYKVDASNYFEIGVALPSIYV